MDALEVLQAVARTYAALKTLSVGILSVTEIEDEGSSNRTAERTQAWFEAPNKVRMEKRGSQGTLLVSDGVSSYYLSVAADRYVTGEPHHKDFLPGLFLPITELCREYIRHFYSLELQKTWLRLRCLPRKVVIY
jgi:hypothetical protein